MNKMIKKVAAVMAAMTLVMAFTACGAKEEPKVEDTALLREYSVYAPDGAPALSLANAIDKANEGEFNFNVVDASTIQTLVTGEEPAADFCVMPVNLASKLLGNGETYKLLGVVTNGNMYILTTAGEELTVDNLSTLAGKTMGVVQLSNVPGLTLQAVLKANNVPYGIIENQEAATADVLNLLEVDAATGVTPAGGCDYYLCPEPAASTKVAKTEGKLKFAGDLQAMYGDGGYPQAVLVVKASVAEEDAAAVKAMLSYMEGSAEFMANTDPATVADLLASAYTEGMTPAFNAANLTSDVIAHCSVNFKPANECKDAVVTFLNQLIDVNPKAASEVSETFFN